MYHAHGRNQDYAVAGEPDAVKVARPVREGADENVPQGNASAAYFTLIVDDAHDLSLEHLMLRKRSDGPGAVTIRSSAWLVPGSCRAWQHHPAEARRSTSLIRAFLQFRRRLDKLDPFCLIAGHTSEEVREILATLEMVYAPLFPQLNLRQWTGSIYTWLTQPVLDPTHSGRVTMDNLMKLVTTALQWSYEAQDGDVRAERLKSAAELLVLRHDTLRIVDGAGPNIEVPQPNGAEPPSANGTERKTVQGSEQQNTTKTVETVEVQVLPRTSPKCTFSRMVVPIDLKRFTASSVTVVECPDCSRTRSLSPVKGVLRFPLHEPRKIQTEVHGKRWSATGKTDWDVVGEERNR